MKETVGMKKYENAIAKYRAVFNDDGTIKVCGRQACKELIAACAEYAPGVDYGNPATGMMNIKNIQSVFASTNA